MGLQRECHPRLWDVIQIHSEQILFIPQLLPKDIWFQSLHLYPYMTSLLSLLHLRGTNLVWSLHLSLLSPLLSNWYIYMLIDPLVVPVLAKVKLTTSQILMVPLLNLECEFYGCNRRLVINLNLKAKSLRHVCVCVWERDLQSSTELYIFFLFIFLQLKPPKN